MEKSILKIKNLGKIWAKSWKNHGILFPKPAKVLNGHFIDCDFINGTPEGDLRTCPLSLELNLVHSLFHSYS